MSKSNKKSTPQPSPIQPISNPVVEAAPSSMPFDDSIYKKSFWGIAIVLLITMPLLSTQYGITADEWVYKSYGEMCLNYFTSFGKIKDAVNYAPRGGEVMYCYSPAIDLISAGIYRAFNLPPYPVRHFMLSLMGVLLMVATGLTGRVVGKNWRAGLIALILIMLSPRIFGDSMNNPKDVTFAAGYIFTICFLIKFMQELPNPSWRTTLLVTLGIGLGLGSRAPGLILVAYTPFFVACEILFRNGLFKTVFGDKSILKNVVLKTSVATIGGYFLGIALWPFALTKPFTNVFTALETLTNFPISIKTIFEGTKIFSTSLPWYYVPKLIAISTPLYFLLGLLIFVLIFFFVKKQFNQRYLLVLVFVAVFPFLYGIYKHSAFYNGWRHTTFLYPPLLVLAAVSYEFLFQKLKGIGQKVLLGILAILCALPLWFMVKNHPYQYTYYNELEGGVKGAYGNYETDYFGASTRQIADWMKANLDLKSKPIIIATDFLNPMNQYFTEYPNVKVEYHRYYQRSEKNWDYGVFLTTRLTPSHFRNKQYFPPTGTIYMSAIGDTPLGVVIKRPTYDDTKGITLLRENKVAEAIPLLENALKADPNNEVIHLYLANAYNNVGLYEKALKESQAALEIFPEYSGAMTTMAISYINLAQFDNAIFMLNEVLEEDPRSRDAVNYLAICYERKGDQKTADYYRAAAAQLQ